MPRFVVPMRVLVFDVSRSVSSSPWSGRISGALSAMSRLAGVIDRPCSVMRPISAMSAQGSTTTPLPITESLLGRAMPEGSSENL